MKKLIWIYFYLALLCSFLHADDKPVVLSMSEVVDYASKGDYLERVLSLRPAIVSKLVENYNCVLLSRANPGCLTFEGSIARFVNNKKHDNGTNTIWAADYAIAIHTQRSSVPNKIVVLIDLQDLRDNIDISPTHISFEMLAEPIRVKSGSMRDYSSVPDAIVEKIKETLNLKKHSDEKTLIKNNVSISDESWAVLPFVYYDVSRMKQRSSRRTIKNYKLHYPDGHISEIFLRSYITLYPLPKVEKNPYGATVAAEMTLQESAMGLRLVDRSYVEDCLNELKLQSISGITEDLAGGIGKIIGADRLLMGFLIKEHAGFRIIVQLVNSRTSVVQKAGQAFCVNEKDIPSEVGRIINRILWGNYDDPEIKASLEWQRKREAKFYKLYPKRQYIVQVPNSSCYIDTLNRMQTLHMLMSDDINYLKQEILPVLAMNLDHIPESHLDVRSAYAHMLSQILQTYSKKMNYEAPLLMQAVAYLKCYDYDKALQCARKHLEQNPSFAEEWVKYIETACAYERQQDSYALQQAKQTVKAIKRGKHNPYLVSPIKINLKKSLFMKYLALLREEGFEDVREEYVLLKELAEISNFISDPGVLNATRYLMLTKKFKGASAAVALYKSAKYQEFLDGHILHIDPRHTIAAAYFWELDRKKEAKAIYAKYAATDPYAKEKLLELFDETTIKDLLRDGKAICDFPSEYRIYCIPVKGCNMNLARKVAGQVGDWFGTEVVMTSEVAHPTGTYSVENQYSDFGEFSRQLLQNTLINDDAVFVYFFTGEVYCPAHWRSVQVAPANAPIVLASHYYQRNAVNLTRSIVNAFARSVIRPPSEDWLGWARYTKFRCGREFLFDHNSLGICIECANDYNPANFALVHKALHSFLEGRFKQLSYKPFSWWKIDNIKPDRFKMQKLRNLLEPIHLPAIISRDKEVEAVISRAQENHAYSQALLAKFYESGYEGIKRDFISAAKWAKLAAAQNDPFGLYILGCLIGKGKGMCGDSNAARNNFLKSFPMMKNLAEKENPHAQCIIGEMYEFGRGVTLNHKEAVKWYQLAANQGYPDALLRLGHMYINGTGVSIDSKKAFKLYTLASNQGHARAIKELGSLYLRGQGCSVDKTKAFDLFYKSALMGDHMAQNNVGWLYFTGVGVAKNKVEAERWFRSASANGNPLAVSNLGRK